MRDGAKSAPVVAIVVVPVPPIASVLPVWLPAKKVVEVAFVAVKVASVDAPETARDERVPTLVRDEARTLDARVAPVSVPAGAITATEPAAVMSPLPFTVKVGIAVEEPKLPVLPFTVASVAATVPGPVAVRSPVSPVM